MRARKLPDNRQLGIGVTFSVLFQRKQVVGLVLEVLASKQDSLGISVDQDVAANDVVGL